MQRWSSGRPILNAKASIGQWRRIVRARLFGTSALIGVCGDVIRTSIRNMSKDPEEKTISVAGSMDKMRDIPSCKCMHRERT